MHSCSTNGCEKGRSIAAPCCSMKSSTRRVTLQHNNVKQRTIETRVTRNHHSSNSKLLPRLASPDLRCASGEQHLASFPRSASPQLSQHPGTLGSFPRSTLHPPNTIHYTLSTPLAIPLPIPLLLPDRGHVLRRLLQPTLDGVASSISPPGFPPGRCVKKLATYNSVSGLGHMLPSYASSAHREKMNRHGYGAGANGQHSSGRNNFSIATDKYDKYV